MSPQPVINYTYIYQALRNNYNLLFLANSSKHLELQDDLHSNDESYDCDKDHQNQKLYNQILSDVDSLEFLPKTLFKMNMVDRKSIRQIQKETGLSYSTIQQSIRETKVYLKNKYIGYDKE
ncbi:hypothetical protein [Flavobacterium chungangensis]|uniref:RNA polymerase sigma factor 70 region 4 type 2 domain-containing protein n=1 Tax=Flavobacterium chungangensis TaxID=2708132 RepID=A0ABV8ZF00_9FLAO